MPTACPMYMCLDTSLPCSACALFMFTVHWGESDHLKDQYTRNYTKKVELVVQQLVYGSVYITPTLCKVWCDCERNIIQVCSTRLPWHHSDPLPSWHQHVTLSLARQLTWTCPSCSVQRRWPWSRYSFLKRLPTTVYANLENWYVDCGWHLPSCIRPL